MTSEDSFVFRGKTYWRGDFVRISSGKSPQYGTIYDVLRIPQEAGGIRVDVYYLKTEGGEAVLTFDASGQEAVSEKVRAIKRLRGKHTQENPA